MGGEGWGRGGRLTGRRRGRGAELAGGRRRGRGVATGGAAETENSRREGAEPRRVRVNKMSLFTAAYPVEERKCAVGD